MVAPVSEPTHAPKSIPANAGIGLRGPHHAHLIEERPAVAWLEAHSENYFARHGNAARALEKIREDYPLGLHGVGLSIGSTDPLDAQHLSKLAEVVRRFQPALVSEHLSWSGVGGRHLNDLLPLPYTEEALKHAARRIARVQDALKREILIENVSTYAEFKSSVMPEWEFLAGVAETSGCGLLLDVNNVYVNARNHGFSAEEYLAGVPCEHVAEFHLAGHSVQRYGDRDVLVDTHDGPVCDEVWRLFEIAARRFGALPTLIEWDSRLPPLQVLLAEARKAETILEQARALAA
jgi:uncharacterized protein (UPF0276 family)